MTSAVIQAFMGHWHYLDEPEDELHLVINDENEYIVPITSNDLFIIGDHSECDIRLEI